MSSTDLYATLNVTHVVSPENLRKAYVIMAKQSHPDRHHGSNEQFVAVQRSWDTLSDPKRRAAYDAEQTRLRVEALLLQHKNGESEYDDDEALNYDTLDLHDDFEYDDEEEAHVGQCRCGETLYVEPDDIEDATDGAVSVAIVCTGCSISYQVSLIGVSSDDVKESIVEEKTRTRTIPARTVHELFFAAAASKPTEPALIWRPTNTGSSDEIVIISYESLAERVRIIARGLRRVLVSRRTTTTSSSSSSSSSSSASSSSPSNEQQPRVGILVSEGPPAVELMLAVWSIGGIVVPLDHSDPLDRILTICNEASLNLVVGHCAMSLLDKCKKRNSKFPSSTYQELLASVGSASSQEQRNDSSGDVKTIMPTDLCHIVFTSGSTGIPKGVLVEHQSLVAYGMAKASSHNMHGSNISSRVLLASSFTFDPFIGDLVTTLCCCSGSATLCLAPREHVLMQLGACLSELDITHICCTPAHWSTLGEDADAMTFPSLRCVSLGGEKMSAPLVRQWTGGRRRPDFQLLNTYGVTEVTVYQSINVMEDEHTSPSRLGVTLPGIQFHLRKCEEEVAEEVEVVEVVEEKETEEGSRHSFIPRTFTHVTGEICISGIQVARGYLNRSILTKQRFLFFSPDDKLNSPLNGIRMYRTGDLGQWNKDETIELIGRMDRQVKLRGRRVELGEIEAVLSHIYSHVFPNDPARIVFVDLISVTSEVSVDEELSIEDLEKEEEEKNKGKSVLVVGTTTSERNDEAAGAGAALFQPLCSWRTVVVKAHVESTLASYMMPSHFFDSNIMPKVARTGKIDRNIIQESLKEALRAKRQLQAASATAGGSSYGGSNGGLMSPVEIALARVWKEHLGIREREVGRLDDFFSLGGDSLSALRVMRDFAKNHIVNGNLLLRNITDTYGNVTHALSPLVMLRHPVLCEYASVLESAGVEIVVATTADCKGNEESEKMEKMEKIDKDVSKMDKDVNKDMNKDMNKNRVNHQQSTLANISSNLNIALRDASENGDVDCVRALLELGADSNSGVTRKVPGVSPLHLAAANSHIEIVRVLLLAGAKTTVCTTNHVCPLHIAASRDAVILKLMLGMTEAGRTNSTEAKTETTKSKSTSTGASSTSTTSSTSSTTTTFAAAFRYLGVTDGRKQTLLHHAARTGNIECTQVLTMLLLENHAQYDQTIQKRKTTVGKTTGLNSRDRWQRTPIHWSVLNGHYDVTEHLLVSGALPQPYDARHLTKMKNRGGKSTHLPMETPVELAIRVHGADSRFVAILQTYLNKSKQEEKE